MWIVRPELSQPYTFVVVSILILSMGGRQTDERTLSVRGLRN
jgi:hypothetical protein